MDLTFIKISKEFGFQYHGGSYSVEGKIDDIDVRIQNISEKIPTNWSLLSRKNKFTIRLSYILPNRLKFYLYKSNFLKEIKNNSSNHIFKKMISKIYDNDDYINITGVIDDQIRSILHELFNQINNLKITQEATVLSISLSKNHEAEIIIQIINKIVFVINYFKSMKL